MCNHQRFESRQPRRHDARLENAVKWKSLTEGLLGGCDDLHHFMETRMRKGSFRNIACLLFAVIVLALPCMPTIAQEGSDLSEDPHFRDELGVNQYTAPSIEKLFATLDSLKPIPSQDLARSPKPLRITNRVKLALSFGVLIGDGFLAVESEDAKEVEPLGRELLRRARGLGVEQRVTRHSKHLLDLAKQSNWMALRKELIVTQKEVEHAMLDLRDEEMAHLLSLGGWLRGLEIGAAAVVSTFTPERAGKLKQLDLLDYYLDRLSTLPSVLKGTPVISSTIAGLKEIREKLSPDHPLTADDAATIQQTARKLIDLIESDSPDLSGH
jgi:hypothetical protein